MLLFFSSVGWAWETAAYSLMCLQTFESFISEWILPDFYFDMLGNGKLSPEVMEVTGLCQRTSGAGSHSNRTIRCEGTICKAS